jgi:hypothetical protein
MDPEIREPSGLIVRKYLLPTGENVRRPVSRVLFRLLQGGDDHSSGPPIAERFSRPTRTFWGDEPCGRGHATSLFGLAPGEVYLAIDVAADAVGSYPTLSSLPIPQERRFAFCGTFSRVAPGGRYPPPFHRGARTFLDRTSLPRPPGHLTRLKCAGLGLRSTSSGGSVQNAGDAFHTGQLQQAHQTRARLAIGNAVDPLGSPVALEGHDGQTGLFVILAAGQQAIAQTV